MDVSRPHRLPTTGTHEGWLTGEPSMKYGTVSMVAPGNSEAILQG